MDERLKHTADYFETMKIGLDEKFKFNCTMCGKCCINRDDILLTPNDVFKMSDALGLEISDFIKKYCEVYRGQSSKIPIVRLLPVGPMKRCPLLKGNRCAVHHVKPVVCAMFPIGRCLIVDDDSKKGGEITVKDIQYIFTAPGCGDKKKEHTVREWLKDFNISDEDKYFIKWQQTVTVLIKFMHENESKLEEHYLNRLEKFIFLVLYLSYDFNTEFFPQFVRNADFMIEKIKDLNLRIGGAE